MDDPRLSAAQSLPIDEIAERLGILDGLQRSGSEWVGPCPVCGGRDRFGLNVRRGVFLCRRCEGKGDGIALVRFVLNLDFPAALTWITGEERAEVDPAEARRREARRKADREKREREENRRRAEAIRAAHKIWTEGQAIGGTDAERYLARRGLKLLADEAPPSLRFHPALPYMVRDGDRWVEAHRGPSLLAEIRGPEGTFTGVHRTWIDPAHPKGKARIVWQGEDQVAKKVLGSKKGGAIRLIRSSGDPTIVMGEGIETTASAWVARAVPGAAYWAGVDLGNMAGRRKLGPGLKYAGIPDLEDRDAFLPPAGCKRLIFIQDGDSDPRLTRAKLEAGLRRAMVVNPGLVGFIVHAGEGYDLNDVIREGAA